MKKEFAVIGLGRFGGSICKALSEEGVEVMAMDIDEDKVNEYARLHLTQLSVIRQTNLS